MSQETKEQLSRIEGLLVLLLQKLGATSTELSRVMNMGSSTVRRNYPQSEVSLGKLQIDDSGD